MSINEYTPLGIALGAIVFTAMLVMLDRTAERRRATLDLLRNLEAAWPPTQRW
jgi:hypothetical protein